MVFFPSLFFPLFFSLIFFGLFVFPSFVLLLLHYFSLSKKELFIYSFSLLKAQWHVEPLRCVKHNNECNNYE